jgi:hypothetical protein
MSLIAGIGLVAALGSIGNLLIAVQIRDRLDRIATAVEKK